MGRRDGPAAMDTLPCAPEQRATTAPARRALVDPEAECPLHIAMRQLAETAVLQHVLHMEGELLPRADLVDALEGWEQVYRLTRTRICPRTREARLSAAELDALVENALPRLVPAAEAYLRSHLAQCLLVCGACADAQECPLGRAPRAEIDVEGRRR